MWQISLPSLRSQYHKPASPSALQILSFPRVASSSPCPSALAAGRYPAVTSLHGLWVLHEAGFVSVYYGCAEAEPWPFALRFWCSWHCIQYRKQILCVASNDEKMSSMISRYLSSFQYHLCYFLPKCNTIHLPAWVTGLCLPLCLEVDYRTKERQWFCDEAQRGNAETFLFY